jgi:hypothetical protein
MKHLLATVLLLAGCVAAREGEAPAARVIVLDGVSYTVEQKESVPYLQFRGIDGGGIAQVPTGESGQAVWISGAPTLLDAFRALSVFCEGVDPGAPAPDAPDTDMVPTVPGTDTFQFDGACS